jgi:hypothetical protein
MAELGLGGSEPLNRSAHPKGREAHPTSRGGGVDRSGGGELELRLRLRLRDVRSREGVEGVEWVVTPLLYERVALLLVRERVDGGKKVTAVRHRRHEGLIELVLHDSRELF